MAALTISMLTAFTLSNSADEVGNDWKMMVLSDVHLMSPDLVEKDGSAFQQYLASDRKLLAESEEILDSVSVRVMRYKPSVLLIAGDLTKDGEKVSHELLVSRYLSKWRDAGINVFVVPGNHDVNNPHAVKYDGGKTSRVATVTPDEFASIYKDYGYGNAIARDSHSLSYVVQLRPSLRLLALDACRYDDNDFAKNTCVTSGRLKSETIDFIKEQAAKAKRDGCKMIAMMHHGVVSHFSMEKQILPEYLVKNNDVISELLQNLGIRVIFTGHLHSHDAASDGALTDIETGSTVSYPNPYRMIKVSGDTMEISTGHITQLGSLNNKGISLDDKTRQFATLSVMKKTRGYLPKDVPANITDAIGNLLGEAYICHLCGDENPTKEWIDRKNKIVETIKAVSPDKAALVDAVASSLVTDTTPKDNTLTIIY